MNASELFCGIMGSPRHGLLKPTQGMLFSLKRTPSSNGTKSCAKATCSSSSASSDMRSVREGGSRSLFFDVRAGGYAVELLRGTVTL